MRVWFVCVATGAVLISAVHTYAWSWQKKGQTADSSIAAGDTAAKNQPVSESRPSAPVAATYIDSLNRGREVYLTAKDVTPVATIITESPTSSTAGAGSSAAPPQVPLNGYQVQCVASSQLEMIKAEQKNLATRTKLPLFIISSPPFYKLAAGDFSLRADAERALAEVRNLGYPDAWIVSRQPRKP